MKLLIGEKISYYRKQKNMTQEQLANQIGISAQAVSGWEREVGYPNITLLPGISHALGVSIDELMGNDEIGVRDDIKNFYEKFWRLDSSEKLKLASEYYHKYPDKYEISVAFEGKEYKQQFSVNDSDCKKEGNTITYILPSISAITLFGEKITLESNSSVGLVKT